MGDYDRTFDDVNEFRAFVARNTQLTITGPVEVVGGPDGTYAEVIPTNVGNVVRVFTPEAPAVEPASEEDLSWLEDDVDGDDIELTD